MARDPFERRRQMKILFAVLAVAVVVSVLLGGLLTYMGQMHSRL